MDSDSADGEIPLNTCPYKLFDKYQVLKGKVEKWFYFKEFFYDENFDPFKDQVADDYEEAILMEFEDLFGDLDASVWKKVMEIFLTTKVTNYEKSKKEYKELDKIYGDKAFEFCMFLNKGKLAAVNELEKEFPPEKLALIHPNPEKNDKNLDLFFIPKNYDKDYLIEEIKKYYKKLGIVKKTEEIDQITIREYLEMKMVQNELNYGLWDPMFEYPESFVFTKTDFPPMLAARFHQIIENYPAGITEKVLMEKFLETHGYSPHVSLTDMHATESRGLFYYQNFDNGNSKSKRPPLIFPGFLRNRICKPEEMLAKFWRDIKMIVKIVGEDGRIIKIKDLFRSLDKLYKTTASDLLNYENWEFDSFEELISFMSENDNIVCFIKANEKYDDYSTIEILDLTLSKHVMIHEKSKILRRTIQDVKMRKEIYPNFAVPFGYVIERIEICPGPYRATITNVRIDFFCYFARLLKYQDELEDLSNDLKNYPHEANSVPAELIKRGLYLVVPDVNENGKICRARVLSFDAKRDLITVFLIDFGSRISLLRDLASFLPKQFAQLPEQSICGTLFDQNSNSNFYQRRKNYKHFQRIISGWCFKRMAKIYFIEKSRKYNQTDGIRPWNTFVSIHNLEDWADPTVPLLRSPILDISVKGHQKEHRENKSKAEKKLKLKSKKVDKLAGDDADKKESESAKKPSSISTEPSEIEFLEPVEPF